MDHKDVPRANAIPAGLDTRDLDATLRSGRFVGLANNTKWNELITVIRTWDGWRPSYRTKCINGFVSEWDVEWFYHLPFPFKYTLWFDIGCYQNLGGTMVDRTGDLLALVRTIGFDCELHGDILRIFGYAPRDYELLQGG